MNGITKGEYERDVFNTHREIEAYDLLSNGYLILSGLPENEGSKSRDFYWLSMKFLQQKTDCIHFMGELEEYGRANFSMEAK